MSAEQGNSVHYVYEPQPPEPFRCRECQRWFMPGDDPCPDEDAEHAGPGCCHYGDVVIPGLPEGTDPGGATLVDVFDRISDARKAEIEALKRRMDEVEARIARLLPAEA